MSNREDRELRKRVLAALAQEPRLDALSWQHDVDARNGTVELTGEAPTRRHRFLAGLVASRVAGVRRVANLILIRPVQRRTDEEIQNEILARIAEDPYLDERNIVVEVEEGQVYLRGNVQSLVRKRLTGAIAWWAAGVSDVINDLEVSPPEADSNEQIAEALKAILEKDPLVDASSVALHVTGRGVVTLTGAVRGDWDRLAAEDDAWSVPGVTEVINLLGVVPPSRLPDTVGPAR